MISSGPVVIRSTAANDDVLSIWEYISRHNLPAAERFLDKLQDTCMRLARMPGMGRLREEYGEGLRVFPLGQYVIFYRPIEQGIEVYRVIHGARNFDALL